MISVLGIDLAINWRSIGSAVLSFDGARWIECTTGAIVWPESTCDAAAIADAILAFALENKISAISLDGPQGWRDPATPGNFVGRDCERVTRTPGKTGTFGVAKPQTWIRWIQCSIEVFDRLLGTPHAILANDSTIKCPLDPPCGKFYVLECFPTSTWRHADLEPLPGHYIDVPTIRLFAARLREVFGLPEAAPGGNQSQAEHDNLQAVVAALPAAGLLNGPCQPLPRGLPAKLIALHRTEGIIWDAIPTQDRLHKPVIRETHQATPRLQPKPVGEISSAAGLMPAGRGVKRGIRLFAYLVEAANGGDAVGISYDGFIAYLHDATGFRQVAGRSFLPSDSAAAVRIASKITESAGGRQKVVRSGTTIDAGMDTFIWRKERPFDRPAAAWHYPIPYTRDQWLSVFPNAARRLITSEELRLVSRS